MSQSRNIQKINEAELRAGILKPELSWHNDYKDQAYIFIGGLNKELTEGDILTVFAQYGIPIDILLVRDKFTGESKGFAYLKYEDQRSTILAIDNLNGVNIAGRRIQVDHVFYEPRDDNKSYRDAVKKELENDFARPQEQQEILAPKKRRTDSLKPQDENKIESTIRVDDDLKDPMANF